MCLRLMPSGWLSSIHDSARHRSAVTHMMRLGQLEPPLCSSPYVTSAGERARLCFVQVGRLAGPSIVRLAKCNVLPVVEHLSPFRPHRPIHSLPNRWGGWLFVTTPLWSTDSSRESWPLLHRTTYLTLLAVFLHLEEYRP